MHCHSLTPPFGTFYVFYIWDRIYRYIEIIRRYITYIQRHIGTNSHLRRYYPVSNVQQYTQAPLSRAQVNRTNSIQQWHGANILISVIYLGLYEMRRRGHEARARARARSFRGNINITSINHHITHHPSPPTLSLIYYIRTIYHLPVWSNTVVCAFLFSVYSNKGSRITYVHREKRVRPRFRPLYSLVLYLGG